MFKDHEWAKIHLTVVDNALHHDEIADFSNIKYAVQLKLRTEFFHITCMSNRILLSDFLFIYLINSKCYFNSTMHLTHKLRNTKLTE